jgi:hypothetical protein
MLTRGLSNAAEGSCESALRGMSEHSSTGLVVAGAVPGTIDLALGRHAAAARGDGRGAAEVGTSDDLYRTTTDEGAAEGRSERRIRQQSAHWTPSRGPVL